MCEYVFKQKLEVKLLSRVQLFVIPWTVAYQAPPSMEFSIQEYLLEWVAVSSSRGSSRPRDRTCVSSASCWGPRRLPAVFRLKPFAFAIPGPETPPPAELPFHPGLCLLAGYISSPVASPVKPPLLPKAVIFTCCVHPVRACAILPHHLLH